MKFITIKQLLSKRTSALILGMLDTSYNDGTATLGRIEIEKLILDGEGAVLDNDEDRTSFTQLVSANIHYNFKVGKLFRTEAKINGRYGYFTRPIPDDLGASLRGKSSKSETETKPKTLTLSDLHELIKDLTTEDLISVVTLAKETLNSRLTQLKLQQQQIELAMISQVPAVVSPEPTVVSPEPTVVSLEPTVVSPEEQAS